MRRYFWIGIVSLALIAVGCARLGMGGRTDQQVASDVQNKINGDASFPDKQLSVTAANGVVTLSGTVSSDAARASAAADAAQVEGVKTVVNNLVVATPDLAGMQADAQPSTAERAEMTRTATAKPSPRATSARRSYSQGSSTQNTSNNNSTDNGLRKTCTPSSGGDTLANSAPASPTPVPKRNNPVGP